MAFYIDTILEKADNLALLDSYDLRLALCGLLCVFVLWILYSR